LAAAERSDAARAVSVANAARLVLAMALTEATGTLPRAKCATAAPTLAEVALVLVRAVRRMCDEPPLK